MLADYSYYTDEFGGTLIPENHWNHAAEAASDWMCAAAFGRLDDDIPLEHARNVKRCCCEMAEQIYSYAMQTDDSAAGISGSPQSEKIGSYSVTYQSAADSISALLSGGASGLSDLLNQIVQKHLARTGLLYKGVDG